MKRQTGKKRIAARTAIVVLSTLLIMTAVTVSFADDTSKQASEKETNRSSVSAAKDSSQLSPKAILEKMTLEQKLAQMLMPSVRDETGGGQHLTKLTPASRAAIEKYGFCGYLFFSQNCQSIEQMTELTSSMQRAAVDEESTVRIPLLLSVDQEGGRIERIRSGSLTPGNMALGASWDATAAETVADVIGREMKSVGFNVDYAPVMDINNNPANPVINLRSFGGNPQAVADMGTAFIRGLQGAGVIATMKHFPGHGDTSSDSHTGLPLIDKSLPELQDNELIPFQAGIDAGADMIMTAHIEFPQIEKDTYLSKHTGRKVFLPATLSDDILAGVLREKMGFDGVIITDAIKMGAIREHFDLVDAAELAINAGVDIIMNPGDITTEAHIAALDQYIQELAARVRSGSISEETVDRAVLRILKLKQQHGMFDEIPEWEQMKESDVKSLVQSAEETIGSETNRKRIRTLTSKTVTMVKNQEQTLPIDAGKTVVLCPEQAAVDSVQSALDRMKKKESSFETESVTVVGYGGLNADYASRIVAGADHVIGISAIESLSGLGKGTAAAFLKAAAVSVHQSGGKFVLISANLPYDVAAFQEADAILLTYGYKAITEIPQDKTGEAPDYGPNLPAAIQAAFGVFTPSGSLPVEIPKWGVSASSGDSVLYPLGYGIRGWTEDYIAIRVSPADTPPDTDNNHLNAAMRLADVWNNIAGEIQGDGILYFCLLFCSLEAVFILVFLFLRKRK